MVPGDPAGTVYRLGRLQKAWEELAWEGPLLLEAPLLVVEECFC